MKYINNKIKTKKTDRKKIAFIEVNIHIMCIRCNKDIICISNSNDEVVFFQEGEKLFVCFIFVQSFFCGCWFDQSSEDATGTQ